MISSVAPLRCRSDDTREPLTDDLVAVACGACVPEAVGELFERFQIPVTRFLSRLVGGSDVEDLVQTTFMQIARGKSRFDGRSTVKTWLWGIASNVARQHIRSSAYRRRLVATLTSVSSAPSSDRLSEQIDARRKLKGVRAAFGSLSDKSRLAFLLCEVEGLSAREASQVLQCNETAIWKRVSETRKLLLKAADNPPPRRDGSSRRIGQIPWVSA